MDHTDSNSAKKKIEIKNVRSHESLPKKQGFGQRVKPLPPKIVTGIRKPEKIGRKLSSISSN